MEKKSKKLKKLTLSTETLRILAEPQLAQVLGGVTRVCGETATFACSGCTPCA